MTSWSHDLLWQAMDGAPEGIVVCEAHAGEHPLVYANPAFVRMTGYGVDELLGRDLRLLQGTDRTQEARVQLRESIAQGEGCRALLRNYRKDGTAIWLEVSVQPLRSDGEVKYVLGFYRDVSERERSNVRRAAGLPSWLREDRLTGLCSAAYLEELLQHDWQVGMREQQPLSLLAFDIDELGSYNETFGRAAGDACIRRVAGVIAAAFRRGADVVARWQGGTVVAIAREAQVEHLATFGAVVAQKVLDQRILSPRARRQRSVSVSVGVASVIPTGASASEHLLQAALRAVRRAKLSSPSRVATASPEELQGPAEPAEAESNQNGGST